MNKKKRGGSLFLLLDSCTAPLPMKIAHQIACPNPSLLANQERLWTFDLDKSQVRGRYNCIRDIRRSHCQSFCACVLLRGSEYMLDQGKISLSRFSVFCVSCFRHWRVINSNSLGRWCLLNIALQLLASVGHEKLQRKKWKLSLLWR
jgi:hypothetical protein